MKVETLSFSWRAAKIILSQLSLQMVLKTPYSPPCFHLFLTVCPLDA